MYTPIQNVCQKTVKKNSNRMTHHGHLGGEFEKLGQCFTGAALSIGLKVFAYN